MNCANCERELNGGEGRPAPASVLWLASFAFAFFHGGMWANQILRKPFCPACRPKVTAFALTVSGLTLTGAAAGLFLLIRLIRYR